MNIEDKAEKKKFQMAICGLWQTLNPTGGVLPIETQRGYLMAMQSLSIEEAQSAIGQASSMFKWFPKPVELIALVRGSTSQRSEIAWSKVVAAMDQAGCSSAVEFDDPAISHAIKNLGGWIGLCNRPKSNDNWTRKEFVAAYQNFDGVALRPARLRGHSGRVVSWRDGRRITDQSVKRVGHVLSEVNL